MIPTSEDMLSKLQNVWGFSKLDKISGFHQIALDTDTLMTFRKPVGCFLFKFLYYKFTRDLPA